MNSSYTRMMSPLAKAKNLGSGGGTHHWWMQRLTAIIMIPLIIWLIYFINSVSGLDANQGLQHLKKLHNIIPAIIFHVKP